MGETSKTKGRKSAISKAAAALGRKGGQANTKAQDAARRANGTKGGRPVKLRVLAGCQVHTDVGLAGTLRDGRPAFFARNPTAARWLARHGFVWGVWEMRGEPLAEFPCSAAWVPTGERP